jgi:hypothetical protein
MDNLRRRILNSIHRDGTQPEAPEIIEVEIRPSEMVMASILADLHELGRIAATGTLSDWETETLGDIAEKAIDAWRVAVKAILDRFVAG